jgi:hypothetical protein
MLFMPEPTEPVPSTTLRGLLRLLTVVQAWALGGAIVSILVGAFGIGVLVQSVRDDVDAAKLSNENAANAAKLSSENTTFKKTSII